MDILVMGGGAIGSVFGGFLAKAGHRVMLIGRDWHMDAVRNAGLTITGIWGNHRITTLCPMTCLPSRDGVELIILTVKSYQTEHAVREVHRHIPGEVPILSLQNGLGNLECIAGIVGRSRTLGGRVIFGAEIPEPGRVKVTVSADAVAIGPMIGSDFPYERAEAIAAIIDEAGIPCLATKDIEGVIWEKVIYNLALNAPAALLEVNYGRLPETPDAIELMGAIVEEAFSVAASQGLSLNWPSPQSYLKALLTKLIPATAAHFPSMLQDIRKGKRTEVEALNGAIVRLGRARGLRTPVNETLTRLIKAKEAGTK